MNNSYSKLKHTLHHPATPGVLLIASMLAALVAANFIPDLYNSLLGTTFTVAAGDWGIQKPLLLWINDGLMAIFFLLVGLELKREVLFGELSDRRKITLPLVGAAGGLIIPSSIYAFINWGDAAAMNGWAIPAATDIAFALGVLALLGSRVPIALKVLLTSIAVMDDLAAIVIIALFYTDQLSPVALGTATAALIALFAVNRSGVRALSPYVVIGVIMWIAVLKSGVHATLAGVALAAAIPAGRDAKDSTGLMYRMEHGLHSWVVFAILPIFAFSNAGIPILSLSPGSILSPVPLGIALGLFIGKQIGVFTFCFVAVKTGIARLPAGVRWIQVYGLALLCGIGFTMSLFIGSLAFEATGDPEFVVDDRVGILVGSFLSAIAGAAVLFVAGKKRSDEAASIEP